MRRIALSALTFTCIYLTATAVSAAGYGEPYLPEGGEGVRGSVRWETLRQAAYTNANVFGAVGAYERYFRPIMAKPPSDDGFFVFAEEMYYTSHIARAPVYCSGIVYATCEDTVAEITFDQYSGGVAMGGGTEVFGAFMATSWSLTAPSNDVYLGTAYTPIMPLLTGWVLPFGKETYASAFPGSIDGILAGYLNAGPVQGSAGYVLSNGLFGDLSLPPLRAFATAVLTDQAKEVGLFKSGIRDLNLPGLLRAGEDTRRAVGETAAFVRDLKLKPPNPSDLADDPALVGEDFWTAHVEQRNIARVIDIQAAYSFAPDPMLHQALVAVHTADSGEPERGGSEDEEWGTSLYAAVGLVRLPTLWYYGVEGGQRLSLDAEIRFGNKEAGGKLFVRRNQAEFLAAFPFGQDAVNTGFAVFLNTGL